jgi:hypothetical protein
MYDTETVVRKGCMPLPFGWVSRTIYAGPYLNKPNDMVGIKCAAEIKSPSAMKVDIQDFGIPYRNEHVYEAVKFALDRAAEGLPIYVGCRGGFGRTGLFLGVLARSMGVSDPVAYVRNNYDRHAIETPEQEIYVKNFDIGPLQKAIKKAKRKAFWHDVFGFFGIRRNYG